MAGQHVDGLAESGDTDVGVGDRNFRQLDPGHLQRIAVHAGDALQVRIVQQHGLPVDRQLHVETEMGRTEL
jgi:hypothetical protein